MRSWLRPQARLLSLLALALAGVLQLGCYKPNISEGGLLCNFDAGTKMCPEGFTCDLASKKCFRHADAAIDRGDVNVDRMDGPMEERPPVCLSDPKPGCTPGSGMCDPTCLTGCDDCTTKCSVNTVGTLTCNKPRTAGYPKMLGQDCTPESVGSAIQTDNCGPGLVCIEDGCFQRCFAFCKNDSDCTNASCTRDVGGGQKVCDVPFVDTCTPLGGNGNTGCVGTNMACYLSSASPTHTICDCPLGGGPANSDCSRTRDCFPGLACVDRQTGASPKCLQVCRLSSNGSDCPGATPGSCLPYKGIPPSSASHPTFGYCF